MVSKVTITSSEHIHPLALHKHLAKHFHKHAPAYAHVAQHVHHALMHCGELILVLIMGMSGVMFANYTGSIEGFERTSTTEISTYLLQAIQHPENILKKGNLISIWKVDGSVENTFTKGYCTYGAARISPEFFPFTDESELTQKRTRGGNAVDRCENAEATGYNIGNTPVQGALVVYGAGGRFGQYGHVGKVMHYDRGMKKIIVRDMARVSTFTMSDRRDDLNTANIKCYIYNKRDDIVGEVVTGATAIIVNPVQEITGTVQQTDTTTTQTDSDDSHTSAPDNSTTTPVTPTLPVNNPQPSTSQPSTSIVTPTPVIITPKPIEKPTPIVIVPPVVVTPPVIKDTPIAIIGDKDITLDFSKVDELGQHFLNQWDIKATLASSTSLQVGSETIFTIEIKDKATQEKISGLLPIIFEFITSNDSISIDYSSIKLITDGKIEIHIKAIKQGSVSLIIDFGGEKVGKIGFDIK